MSSTSESAIECDKLVHRIAMKYDPEYRVKEMQGRSVTSAMSFDDLKAIALAARARGEITCPGDEKRKFYTNK